jgi:hypothetical protein
VRLYYHPESDSLFWDEFASDPLCEDVTDEQRFQDAAALRGIKCHGKISTVIDAHAQAAALTVRGCGTIWKDEPRGLASAIQKSYKAWERKPSDFYPTPYDGTESLIPLIERIRLHVAGPIRPFKVWEPCSGDLDMTRVLEWHAYEVTSTELRDTGQGITGFDFLRDDPTEKWGWIPDPDMIVMNPPFSLAAEFILKALSYTPNVACLVKIDYWNAISRLPLWEKHIPAFFLPLTFRLAFLKAERGNSPLMNCAWVVWTADEFRDLGTDICVTEPLRKRVYPGYQGDGIRKSLAVFGQAVDELTEAMCARSRS